MNKETFKEVIKSLSSGMSDLELYRSELENRESIFELFFDNYFRKAEGMPCSHDKSIYVSKAIIDYLSTGIIVKLTETYKEYQLRGGNIGGITELDKSLLLVP